VLGHFLLLHDLTEGRTVARAVLANDACATQRTIHITVSTFLGSISSRGRRPASRAPRSVPFASPSPRTLVHDFHRRHHARRRELGARRNREYVPTFFVRFAISNHGFPSLLVGIRRDVSTRSAGALQGFHGDPNAGATPHAASRERRRAGIDAYKYRARYPSSFRSRALYVPLKRALKRRMGRARGPPRRRAACASTTDLCLLFVCLTRSNVCIY